MPIVNVNNKIMIRTKALKTATTWDGNLASQTVLMRLIYNGGKAYVRKNKVYVQVNGSQSKYHIGFLDPQYTKLFTEDFKEVKRYEVSGGVPVFQVRDGEDYFVHKFFGLNIEIECYDI